MSATTAQIEIVAGTSRLPSGLRAALKAMQGFGIAASRAIGGIGQGGDEQTRETFGERTKRIGKEMGGTGRALAVRGLDALFDQGKQVIDFERGLTRFGIAARLTKQEIAEVRTEMRATASDTGIGADDVLRGARAYVDIAGAESYTTDKMRLLARTAQASQSDIGDLAQVMFQLEHAMHVSPGELEDTFSGLINMSKDGAVHFAQMQAEINELAPQAARYGMVGRAGANQLAAMMQVARTGFGTVSEMGTGITRVFTGLTNHASKFKKYGVDVFNIGKDGTKTWRKFSDIFQDLRTNNVLSKDPELMRKAFGRSEADRTIRMWMEGTEALKRFEEAGRVNGVIVQDLGTYAESSAGRMDIAFERLRNKVAEVFTPERIEMFSRAVESLAAKLEPVVNLIGKVGDVYGKFYGAGKAIRGFLTPGDSEDYKGSLLDETHQGLTPQQVQQKMQARHTRWLTAKRAIAAATRDDETTPESDELAVRARFDPRDKSGEGAQSAGAAYIEAAHITPEQVAAIRKKIFEKDTDADIAGGKGKSAASVDMVNAFNASIKQVLVPAMSRALIDAGIGKAPAIHMDGAKVDSVLRNNANARRH